MRYHQPVLVVAALSSLYLLETSLYDKIEHSTIALHFARILLLISYNVPHSAVSEAMPPRIKGCAVPIAAIENSSVASLRNVALNAATSTMLLKDTSKSDLNTCITRLFHASLLSNTSRAI